MSKGLRLFLIISAMTGLALGLSDAVFANYFKEAYGVNAAQRGFIEFPRELPGVLTMVFLAGLSFLGNIRSAIVAQCLSVAALVVLGLFTPSFEVMLVFLFLFSSGMHMYMPLGDSIGLSLADENSAGKVLGQAGGVRMAFTCGAGIITFVGFRFGWFSFDNPITVFLLAAACFIAIAVLLARLRRETRAVSTPKARLVFRRAYLRYYIVCALFGGRKQIMIVYSPWVLIELLDFRADTMSILAVIGALVGIFFMPRVGKWIDRFGARKVMMAEALAFIAIYTAYGFLSKGLADGTLLVSGAAFILVYLLNVVDRMTAQFGMVRTIYMRSIAIKPEDVTPSLSMGMGIDHIVAIGGSALCGIIWYNWGPEFVFIIAGALSLGNLLVARGIEKKI
ncbi:MFS transporter [Clostridia bacterium]|nr:MFS transporter [Clostridia bacterium]